tara:strand:+ start:149 stop:301 length:153 start_codon:yes stop_codon:yes gene_type:complete
MIQVGEMIAVRTKDLTEDEVKQIEIALLNAVATFKTFDDYMYNYLTQEEE